MLTVKLKNLPNHDNKKFILHLSWKEEIKQNENMLCYFLRSPRHQFIFANFLHLQKSVNQHLRKLTKML